MISALLVKEDFVLMTAGNKVACDAMTDWVAGKGAERPDEASIARIA